MSKKLKALKALSVDELKAKVSELDEQVFKLKMQKVTGQLTNSALIGNTRRELAQAKTLISLKGKSV